MVICDYWPIFIFFPPSLTCPIILKSDPALGRLAKTACTSGLVFQGQYCWGAPEGTEIHFLSYCVPKMSFLEHCVDLSQVSQCLTVSLPSIFH